MNAVILTSVVSAGNHALFAGTRVLYGLATTVQAPSSFAWTTRAGVPLPSLLATSSVSALCFGSSFIGNGELWGWLQNLVGVSNQVGSLRNSPLRAPLDIDSGLTLGLPRLNVLTVSLDCMVIYWNRIVAFPESMAASRQAVV